MQAHDQHLKDSVPKFNPTPLAPARRAPAFAAQSRLRPELGRQHLVVFLDMLGLLTAALSLKQPQLSRRSALCGGAAALLPSLLPTRAHAAAARVAAHPPLEYLEPIYELKLSLDALVVVAPQPERWPALRQRMRRFCGGPLSEQYYYSGLVRVLGLGLGLGVRG